MATYSEVVYSVINQVTAGNYTDDNMLSFELVGHVVNNVRSTLMKDYYEKTKFLDPSFYQKNCCLEVICEKVECNNVFSGQTDKVINIPNLANYLGQKAILYLGPASYNDPYNYVPLTNISYYKDRRFGGKLKSYTIIGNQVHLHNISISGLKYVCIIGAFEEPIPECGIDEGSGNWEYPIPGHLLHKLELLSIQQITTTFLRNTDIANDGREIIIGNTPKSQE